MPLLFRRCCCCSTRCLSYGVALGCANRVHDRVGDDALTLAKLLRNNPLGSCRLSAAGAFPAEVRPGTGAALQRAELRPRPARRRRPPDAAVEATGVQPAEPVIAHSLDGHALRAAIVRLVIGARLTVAIARDPHRREQARECLLLAVVMQTSSCSPACCRCTVRRARGLRVLDPLTARLAARSNEAESDRRPEHAQEGIQPLTRTINALFGRLGACTCATASPMPRTSCGRTSTARWPTQPATRDDALAHIQRLSRVPAPPPQLAEPVRRRCRRVTTAPDRPPGPADSREMVAQRVHEADPRRRPRLRSSARRPACRTCSTT
ncbi:hypothetical protein [Rhodanobacter lindaniclasticus]